MRSVSSCELREGRAYRSDNGDLLLVTRVVKAKVAESAGLVRVSFVWLGSADGYADSFLGEEHSFTASSDMPGSYYEEL